MTYLLDIDELYSGTGPNQIGSLQRASDTRWGSHLKSLFNLIKMFSAICEVLLIIIDDGTTSAQRGDADAAYEVLTSFEFVFILHLMRKLLEISDMLCQALQLQSQDILNVMHLVSSTKLLIQKLRDDGWGELVGNVRSFCQAINVPTPDLNALYVIIRGKGRHQQDEITLEHHYKVDILKTVIDAQFQESNNKFNDNIVELITLSSTLDPREMCISFRIEVICRSVQKFYTNDFADYEMLQLRTQFEHFDHVRQLLDFRTLETISDLCQWLVKTRNSKIDLLVFRVATLILTLPVSTTTTERSFSAMNIVKPTRRNKMVDDFLNHLMVVYIEKEIANSVLIH